MTALIEPRVLKGFRDFLPAAEIERRGLVERIEAVFRGFGYAPIDTPALEYTEILLGKGGGETEKQVYRFSDHGGRDVALRFDLTVPFARFAAEHRASLTFPFKRYHIAKVWRGENTQRGRYREFTQCDFDCIGSDGVAADFEILMMMKEALAAAGAGGLTIRLNHRGLFNRFLQTIGAAAKAVEILRAVDKLAKIGRDETLKLLAAELDQKRAELIVNYVETKGSWDETLDALATAAGGDNPDSERLRTLRGFMFDAGVQDVFVIDPSITRGLDYYTGIVFETFLDNMPSIGSVCSGGRYDNLSGLYSKEPLSGVGSSIGLDRLIAALEALGMAANRETYAELAVICVDEGQSGAYQRIAQKFRSEGIPTEVFFEAKKQGVQFALAEKKGVRWALIPAARLGQGGAKEAEDDTVTLRDLRTRRNIEALSVSAAIAFIRNQKILKEERICKDETGTRVSD
ncbi:MAG: histidine--tRNA ligase [Spirochaetaceae bacterium]|jgi:histidyl-tRNA synthetase|nr:histidine--tRNA ligase [Spirochaetaceae bacterium]